MTDVQNYNKELRKHPAPFNSVTNEIDFESKRLKKVIQGKCGDLWRTSMECYVESGATIKGLDCADTFNELIACCKKNPKDCHPRMQLAELEEDE